ncbi:MAG: hypothetical protein ACSHXB_07210 [Sulfitobacter sp.]
MRYLNAQLLAAHAAGDIPALIRLYTVAADQVEQDDLDAACFYLTHAYVFALESGDATCPALRARLVAHGREPVVQASFSPA